jgi:indole-3-glycerol phosphate synthase
MSILEKIVAQKHKEVQAVYQKYSFDELHKQAEKQAAKALFSEKVRAKAKAHIIAEFKRHSPSKGDISPNANIKDIIPIYSNFEASAISVLTDEQFFKGKLQDLEDASKISATPLLRKDFIIDPIQIAQAKLSRASMILLIASILEKKQIEELSAYARSLGMDVLFEIHNESEIEKICSHINCIGVNTRNLNDFNMKLDNAAALLEKLPQDLIKVAESGIQSPAEVEQLYALGYDAFLIGETFMRNIQNPTFIQSFFTISK